MQKKLLLLCIIVNYMMTQASEAETIKQKDFIEYISQRKTGYHNALVDELSGKERAIDNEDQKNEQANADEAKNNVLANKLEEEDLQNKQYDGKRGYFGTPPTSKSETGRKFIEYEEQRTKKDELSARDKEEKDKIYQEISKDIKKKKDIFTSKILPDFKYRLEKDRFFIVGYCLPALKNCGMDLDCYYDKEDLSSRIYTDPAFGDRRQTMLYACFAKLALEHDVPLTAEEMKIIAEQNPETKMFFAEMQKGIEDLSILREEISNPKKQEEDFAITEDLLKDQNKQDLLST